MRLYNIKTSKLISTFSSFKSDISCIESSPAGDVCAIGLLDGTIHLPTLNQDEYLFTLYQFSNRYKHGFVATMRNKQTKKRNLDFEVLRFEGIKSVSLGLSRESSWDKMTACHEKSPVVTTWNTTRHTLGKHKLVLQRISMISYWNNSLCESSCISPCGNFGILGYSCGHLDVFNLQSGIYRRTFVDMLIKEKKEHEFPIRGISMDHLIINVFSICGSGVVKQWRFKSRKLYMKLQLNVRYAQTKLHPVGDSDEPTLVLFDIVAFRVVRIFDGTYIARSIDIAFAKGAAGVVLAMISNNAVLVTGHSDQLGVFLCVTKELYLGHLLLKSLPFDFDSDEAQSLSYIIDLDLKSVDVTEFDECSSDDVVELENEFSKLICVSSEQYAQWTNLQRNNSKESPKLPPFFHHLVTGLETRFNMTALPGIQFSQEVQQSRNLKLGKLRSQSKFAVQLKNCKPMNDFEASINYLKGLYPSAIDVGIHGLVSDVTDIVTVDFAYAIVGF